VAGTATDAVYRGRRRPRRSDTSRRGQSPGIALTAPRTSRQPNRISAASGKLQATEIHRFRDRNVMVSLHSLLTNDG